MQELTIEARNKMAALYGLLLGVYAMIYSTVVFAFMGNMMIVLSVKVAAYFLFLVILALLTIRVRKANGGYLSFKEAYSVIFITVLVAGFLYIAYNYVYTVYIDKDYAMKLKASTLSWMEKLHTPEEAMNKAADEFDKQAAESKTFNFKNNLMAFFGNLLIDCLCGLLIALIVKREKPEFQQQ